jgi:uncharacterized SAM-binding protein YcdF (DUF218 family)
MKPKLDAILVLGSGKYESRRKARAAAEIFRERGSKECIVVACGGMPGKYTFEKMFKEEAEYIEDILLQEAVPRDRIRKDKTSRTTYRNLVNASEFIRNLRSIGIVTSNAHTPRARVLAEKVLVPLCPGRKIYSFRAKPKGIYGLFQEMIYMFFETFYA